ncbi:MAG: CHASE3 domain-containing protein [Burkholderiaceae bacterium]|nr:CHASE3 domain-containing protein [Burkholderiaceae bacterium]
MADRSRLITVAVALVGATCLLLVNEWAIHRARAALARDDVLLESRVQLQQLRTTMLRAENAQRGYLLTGDPADTEPFHEAQQQVEPLLARLREAYRDSPQRAAAAGEAEELTRRKLAEMATTIQLMSEGRVQSAHELVKSGIGGEYMRALESLVTDAVATEAARMKQQRAALLDTLALGRLAIAGLLLISVMAMSLYMRQSRQREIERAAQAQALRGERDKLESEVARRTADLRRIAQHLQAAREDERSHLARELHDELGGLLTAAKLDLARLRRPLREIGGERTPELEERVAHLVQTLDSVIALKRRIIEDLRPSALSNLGLKIALEGLAADFAERSGLAVQAQIEEIELDDEREITLYRVLQESLTNITRYAKATRVQVRLARVAVDGAVDGDAVLEVCDDGVGFDTAQVPLRARGLAGMRFRMESCAGSLLIASRPGAGTTVTARLPLRASATGDAAPAPDAL